MTAADAYPDDIEALKPLLLERDARIGHLQDVVESHKAANATAKAEIEHLKLLIAKLRRMQFGRSSEKLDHQIEQLELRLEELDADEGAAPIEVPKTPRTAPVFATKPHVKRRHAALLLADVAVHRFIHHAKIVARLAPCRQIERLAQQAGDLLRDIFWKISLCERTADCGRNLSRLAGWPRRGKGRHIKKIVGRGRGQRHCRRLGSGHHTEHGNRNNRNHEPGQQSQTRP
ncbi:hypothetical protein PSUB009319_40670 [Ralstonia sp. SET104]|nr:hypothetical protein PSUB009319_40670 [Ralstonia sp. SET104]